MNIVLSLVAIPIFVAKLGLTAFGLFSIVTLLGNLNAFTNLGLNTYLVQYLARNGKSRESDRHVVVSFAILFLVLLPLTIVCLLLRSPILTYILNVPPTLHEDGIWLFDSVLIANILLVLGQVFVAILDSQQKVYLSNIWQTIYNITYWTSILAAIFLGFSLRGVAVASVLAAGAWFALVALSSLKLWGKVSTGDFRNEIISIAKSQLGFGVQVYFSGLANLLYEPLTKILVSHWIGIRGVAILDVGLRVKNGVYGAISRICYPLFPYMVKIKEQGQIRKIVHDVSQKAILFTLPLSLLVLISARPIVHLIFRQDIELISLSISAFLVSYLLGSVTVIPIYYYLLSHGHVGITLNVQLINAAVNFAVLLLLHRDLGYVAVVVAGVCAIAASFAYLFYCQGKFLRSYVFDNLAQAITVMTAFIVMLILADMMKGSVATNPSRVVISCTAIVFASVILYRSMDVFSSVDITRYLGDNTISRLVRRFLCR